MAKEKFTSAGRNDGRLYYAVVRGDWETANSELRIGDIDLSLQIHGKSFLRHAGEWGHNLIASLLIEHGLDPNEVYGKQGRSLLHFAAATSNVGFTRVLLDNGANPSPTTHNGSTPLHFAARGGQSFLAIKLLDAGADLNAQDIHGRTPLQLAFAKGRIDTSKLLKKRGGTKAVETNVRLGQSNVAETSLE